MGDQIDSSQKNLPSWFVRVENVTTAGTPVNLSDRPILDGISLTIRARPTNTGVIYVATSSANASGTHRTTLNAAQSMSLCITNDNLVWIDSSVDGEGVEFWAEGPGAA
mgnify:CR=1 FL=1